MLAQIYQEVGQAKVSQPAVSQGINVSHLSEIPDYLSRKWGFRSDFVMSAQFFCDLNHSFLRSPITLGTQNCHDFDR